MDTMEYAYDTQQDMIRQLQEQQRFQQRQNMHSRQSSQQSAWEHAADIQQALRRGMQIGGQLGFQSGAWRGQRRGIAMGRDIGHREQVMMYTRRGMLGGPSRYHNGAYDNYSDPRGRMRRQSLPPGHPVDPYGARGMDSKASVYGSIRSTSRAPQPSVRSSRRGSMAPSMASDATGRPQNYPFATNLPGDRRRTPQFAPMPGDPRRWRGRADTIRSGRHCRQIHLQLTGASYRHWDRVHWACGQTESEQDATWGMMWAFVRDEFYSTAC